MKLKKKALLYDIANMAFTIADCGDPANHSLHRVRDICQDGNIDRVARVLGLAYSNILSALLPLLETPPKLDPNRDNSASPHDYYIYFRKRGNLRFLLTKERELKIKETAHEFMVSKVMYDWLGIVLPMAADVWKERMEHLLASLKEMAAEVAAGAETVSFGRRLNPF